MAGDETYYWLWGQYPALGYFSKPPLIGWLYGLLSLPFGPSVWIYKAAATLIGAGTLWLFYRTLWVLTDNRELAWWGLLAFGLTPAHLLLSSILTIDAPLLLCWTGGMYFTARLLRSDRPSPASFVGLFAFLALGHLSKQMMLVQLPLILVLFAIYRRDLLASPKLWATLVGSLVALIPPMVWNAQNNWITVAHTAHHFEPGSADLLKGLGRLGEFWGALAGLISPVFFLLFFPALRTCWRRRRHRVVVFCFLFGAAGVLVMSGMAFRQRINPNWPAAFLPACLGLILIWAFNQETRKRWLRLATWVGGAFSAFLMVFLLLLEPLAGPLAKLGLEPQRRGWQGYPELVEQTLAMAPEAEQLVFDGHRFTASQFAFHGADPGTVFLWNEEDHAVSQFDFFPPPGAGRPTLVVVERKKASRDGAIPPKLAAKLRDVEQLGELPMHPVRDYPRFTIYLANDLEAWIP